MTESGDGFFPRQCPECGEQMIRAGDDLDVERKRDYVCPKCGHREPGGPFDIG